MDLSTDPQLASQMLGFSWDVERAIDDFVFLCFFVGNDFLPHMPSLMIQEGAIDTLIEIYKKCLPRMGGFMTNSGEVDLIRVEMIAAELGLIEEEIFRRRLSRQQREDRREQHREEGKLRNLYVPAKFERASRDFVLYIYTLCSSFAEIHCSLCLILCVRLLSTVELISILLDFFVFFCLLEY